MASGKPVECRVRHADGTSETLKLNHSFSAAQLDWFRKGSALNVFHGGAKAPAKKAGGKSTAAKPARKARKKPAAAKKKRKAGRGR
jgi:hypothetical protein